MLNRSHIGLLITGPHGFVEWMNDTAGAVFGIPHEEAVGQDIYDLVLSALYPAVEQPDRFADHLLRLGDAMPGRAVCRVQAGAGRIAKRVEYWSQPLPTDPSAGGRIYYFVDVTHLAERPSRFDEPRLGGLRGLQTASSASP